MTQGCLASGTGKPLTCPTAAKQAILRRRMMASPTSRIRLIENANILIAINPTPKGLHYTRVAVSSSVAVILGGG